MLNGTEWNQGFHFGCTPAPENYTYLQTPWGDKIGMGEHISSSWMGGKYSEKRKVDAMYNKHTLIRAKRIDYGDITIEGKRYYGVELVNCIGTGKLFFGNPMPDVVPEGMTISEYEATLSINERLSGKSVRQDEYTVFMLEAGSYTRKK